MKLFTTASVLALLATAAADSAAPAVALRGAAGRVLVEDTNVLEMVENMDRSEEKRNRGGGKNKKFYINNKMMIEVNHSDFCLRLDGSDFSGYVYH
jgi:hypothetical protein